MNASERTPLPLKKRTKYACATCGKTSLYTGDLTADRHSDGYCLVCGSAMVEEGPKRFIIEFEHVSAMTHPEVYDGRTERARRDVDPSTFPEEWWSPSQRQDTEHGIRQQYEGMQKLINEGEFIRKVRVLELPEWAEGIDVTASFAGRFGRQA